MVNKSSGNALASKTLFNGDGCQFKRVVSMHLELSTTDEQTIRNFSNNEALPIQIHGIDPDAMDQVTDLHGIGSNSRA